MGDKKGKVPMPENSKFPCDIESKAPLPNGMEKEEAALLSDEAEMLEALQKVDYFVNKSYLPFLQDKPIENNKEAYPATEAARHVCLFPIEEIVYDKSESRLQKLSSVYSSAAFAGTPLVWLLRGYASGQVKLYLGSYDDQLRVNGAYPKTEALQDSFRGNFPGCAHTDILNEDETRLALIRCFDADYTAVTSVSCIASPRDLSNRRGEMEGAYFQGIEKLTEAMNGKDYTIAVLSEPVMPQQIRELTEEYQNLYSELNVFAKITRSMNSSESITVSKTLTRSLTESIGKSTTTAFSRGQHSSSINGMNLQIGTGVGKGLFSVGTAYSHSESRGTTQGQSESEGDTHGHAENQGTSAGKSSTSGSMQGMQITIENKQILEILSDLDTQIKRLRIGRSAGMFSTAAYVLASTIADAKNAACTYKALVTGDNTGLESTGINTWEGDAFCKILDYLKHMRHPVFALERKNGNTTVSATPQTRVTAQELAVQMGIPYRQVDGFSIRESVSFGRNIQKAGGLPSDGRKVRIGWIYHLGRIEKKRAEIDLQSLSAHTFVCGASGSGKSNTIYQILNGVQETDPSIRFMVIEPAKGDYKYMFGGREDVAVYGTNPDITKLLRLNPFRFPRGIRVLEHIDRLIDIFSVCWPLYAAMPVILRKGIERAYVAAGWNLKTSRNRIKETLYPDFTDVKREVEHYIDESKYSGENKSDYKGSLLTRLDEMCGGMNEMMFVSDDLSDEELFEENVIIDLSRLGSADTMALIMGMLVMRLTEYRIVSTMRANVPLKHLVVLEEAHNLLKRTSTEQNMESANITGKSVEMISAAIAQMRSYGQGFIIADQSPGLMDLSVIRNTSTKILMCLPEVDDREATGRSIGLNPAQTDEIFSLPNGVGVVYQSGWTEAVLVKMEKVSEPQKKYEYPEEKFTDDTVELRTGLAEAVLQNKLEEWLSYVHGDPEKAIVRYNLSSKLKCAWIHYLRADGDDNEKHLDKCRIVCELFQGEKILAESGCLEGNPDWQKFAAAAIALLLPNLEKGEMDDLLAMILRGAVEGDLRYEKAYLELVRSCNGHDLKRRGDEQI